MRSPPPPYESSLTQDEKASTNYAPASDTMSEKAMLEGRGDLEAAKPRDPATEDASSGKHAAEYQVAARTKYTYLGLYFGLNLGLTLFNKAILGKVGNCLPNPSRCGF